MNRKELIAAMADNAQISKEEVEKVLTAFTDVVGATLKKGEKVQILGFGNFEVANRAERKGRNLQTGEEVTYPATNVPKFKPGKKLKEIVN